MVVIRVVGAVGGGLKGEASRSGETDNASVKYAIIFSRPNFSTYLHHFKKKPRAAANSRQEAEIVLGVVMDTVVMVAVILAPAYSGYVSRCCSV